MENQENKNEYVSYEEFKKMDIRVGTIREVEPVPETDKLLKCQIDFGEIDEEGNGKLRQIVSGIHEYYPDPSILIGKQVLYIVNLEPRTIKGVESNGMLMAVDGKDDKPVFLTPEFSVNAGVRIH
ncbi:MAG TPA: methionine--tRNA ligase [Candidatus Paceibacterota bacterium]|nr:methionine--tRNA ligase [Candidatus Paceibacterota bacterium]